MSTVYCSAPIHTHIYIYIYIYIYVCVCVCVCDTLPLENPKIHLHTALLCITWGLIWDLKIKKELPIEIKILSRIPKIREGGIIYIEKIQKFYHLKSQLKILGKLLVS